MWKFSSMKGDGARHVFNFEERVGKKNMKSRRKKKLIKKTEVQTILQAVVRTRTEIALRFLLNQLKSDCI